MTGRGFFLSPLTQNLWILTSQGLTFEPCSKSFLNARIMIRSSSENTGDIGVCGRGFFPSPLTPESVYSLLSGPNCLAVLRTSVLRSSRFHLQARKRRFKVESTPIFPSSSQKEISVFSKRRMGLHAQPYSTVISASSPRQWDRRARTRDLKV